MVTKGGRLYLNVGAFKGRYLPYSYRPTLNLENHTLAINITKTLRNFVRLIFEKLILLEIAFKVFETEVRDLFLLIGPWAAEQDFFFILRLL